jgi:hypothetical protein
MEQLLLTEVDRYVISMTVCQPSLNESLSLSGCGVLMHRILQPS